MSTQVISYAAANIVSTQEKGAAFTINIPTKVTVDLLEKKKIIVKISSDLKKIATRTLQFLGYSKYGLKIEIENKIPKGLGKEEAISLALMFAIAGEIAKKHGSVNELKIDKSLSEQFLIIDKKIVDKRRLLNLCISTNKKLKLEKLVASFYGGFVVTDNKTKKILRRGDMEELFVNLQKIKISKKRINVKNELAQAWNEALKGNLYTTMKLNALVLNENVKEFMTSNILTVSLSSPYIIQLFRKNKINTNTQITNSGVKILEKPNRIFKTREFLGLREVKRANFF